MISLPREYVVAKFFEFGRSPYYNRFNSVYQCSCPICMESPKKKRCYYIPENENIFCHNCGWSSKPFKWIKRVADCSTADIINEVKDYEVTVDIDSNDEPVARIETETLPQDSINLSDSFQCDYYADNKIYQIAQDVIKSRRR